VILSAPHFSALHEIPNDYWRFTRFGLEHLLRAAGFDIVSVEAAGGLLAFLGHLCSIGWMLLCPDSTGLRRVALKLNRGLLIDLLGRLDQAFGCPQRLPCDYVAVARKPGR
jgi:hypothetical protein